MRIIKSTLGLKHAAAVLAGAALVALAPSSANAMDPFVDSSAQLVNQNSNSGAPMAVADMNADGLDDVVHLDGTRHLQIEYQQADGSFEAQRPIDTMMNSWSMAIADLDGNGYNDIFVGDAFNAQRIYLANDDGTAYTPTDLGGSGIFVQCSSFADINNDGDLDFFVCHDVGKSLVYHGDGTGALTQTYENLDPVSTVPSDNSGNYGNVWTDYDLDGDIDLYISKCRQGNNNPNSGERLNLLFENDGEGNYQDVAEAVGLLPRGQTWASDFADIDNDGDLDAFILNHNYVEGDAPSHIYENDGTGQFSAITDSAGMRAGLDDVGLGIQTFFGDFDNDAYVDLLVSSGNGDHQVFFNNADGTFTLDNSVLAVGNRTMQSFSIGDLNNDGALDILAGFGASFNQPTGNSDLLLLNPANNGNNWLKVHLTGVDSNASAVGAVVQITGAWGTQTREIRAGESYGVSHSLIEHFGLGTEDTVESLTVTWPSGRVDTLDAVDINTTIDITECDGGVESFVDADNDGFGDPATAVRSCEAPKGNVLVGTDCDDEDENLNPDVAEVCDEVDNNCNDEVDEGVCESGSSGENESSTGELPTTDSDSTTGPVDPTTASSGASETDTDDSAGADDDGGGCAVSTPSTDATFLLMLLGFGAVPLARRRKRC